MGWGGEQWRGGQRKGQGWNIDREVEHKGLMGNIAAEIGGGPGREVGFVARRIQI